MGMSANCGPPADKAEIIALLRKAVDLGVTFDTAKVYGPFTKEELVGKGLAPVRDQVVNREPGVFSKPKTTGGLEY
jgi:aryl-alcohol dehydrogenase-like predicted oxidoreductase